MTLLVVAACDEPPAGPVASSSSALQFGDLGLACPPNSCGGANETCGNGFCACKAGFVACGLACVDIASDAANCGFCGNTCGAGTACYSGACSTHPPIPPTTTQIEGFVTVSSCGGVESHPSVSLSTGLLFQANVCAGSSETWAPAWNAAWSASKRIPAIAGFGTCGDTWTASSGYNHMEYLSARTLNTPNCIDASNSATGIAATTAAHLSGGLFDYPASWAIPGGEAGDGQSIAFDQGGTALWLVASNGSPNAGTRSRLYHYPVCHAGAPGSPACPRQLFGGIDFVDVGPISSHSTVVVNPCNHHALTTHVDTTGQVVLDIVDGAGAIITSYGIVVAQFPDHDCQQGFDCAGGNQWLCPSVATAANDCSPNRYVPRVQIATKVVRTNDTPRCFAYLGYDESVSAGLGNSRMRAVLQVLDVTTDAPQLAGTFRAQALSNADSFGSTPVASRYDDSVGWFFFATDTNSIHVSLKAVVSRDPQFANNHLVDVSPSMTNHWVGDNLSELVEGLPGGGLFATWPSTTTIQGARVIPQQ